ncbi:MAG: heme exporter protein CcmD [Gammaproteobacteria bacterium]|jgi:heme exporter protein CcmD|nr:heme exporter protein CcmD [Gammaproteobacteria bacterium]
MNIEWMHGQHAYYIFTAYALTLAIVVYCALMPVLRRRALMQNLRLQQRSKTVAARRHD